VAPLLKEAKSRKPLNFKEVQGFFISKKTQKKGILKHVYHCKFGGFF